LEGRKTDMHPGWRKNYLRYKSYFLNVAGQYRERTDVKVYLEILLSLATVTIFSVFALRPTLLTIAELIKEIETKNGTIAIIDSKIDDLSKAQRLTDQQKANIALLKIAIPQEPSPDIFARQVEVLTQKNQTPLSGFSLGKTTILGDTTSRPNTPQAQINESGIQSDQLTFSLQTKVNIAEYEKASALLGEIEKLRRPVGIGSFTFNAAEDKEEGEKILIFSITGFLPYLESEVEK
jgi:hypothetical protein